MKLPSFLTQAPWLSACALWVVIGAWAAAGVWGWSQAAAGVMAAVTIALTVGCQVFAARAASTAAKSSGARRLVTLALGAACLLWTGWSGKQALAINEAQGRAPYETAIAAQASAKGEVAKIESELSALPALRSDIPAKRIGALQTARDAEIVRLTPLLASARAKVEAVVIPAAPAPKMPQWLSWSIVALIEALEFFGFWAIGAAHVAGEVIEINAGRELVNKRWAAQRAKAA